MRDFLRKKLTGLAACTSGNATMMTAFGLPALLGAAGYGVDTAQMYMWHRELQHSVDQVLQAYFFELSQRLSVFVSLIATNCIVLGRTESFARSNPPVPAMVDALGSGLGYGLVLVLVGACRELFGTGKLLGWQVLPLADQGGWFTPLSLMLLAPSAFFLLSGLVWMVRSIWPEQAEAPDFPPHPTGDDR